MAKKRKLLVEFWQGASYDDHGGDWYWRALAKNGNVVADSSEGYSRRIDAVRGAKAARAAMVADLDAAAEKK